MHRTTHSTRCNRARPLPAVLPAAGAVLSGDQRAMCQLLQHLGHKRRGDAILLCNLAGAASVLLAMHRQVLDGNQTVIGFLGKLEHRSRDFLDDPLYGTESVAHEVYPQVHPKVNRKLSSAPMQPLYF